MKKSYLYLLLAVAVAFLGYNSVYFEKLSERQPEAEEAFDYHAFADSLYYQGILKLESPIELTSLLEQVKANPDQAFEAYGNRLGIGNSAYFMVKYTSTIFEKNEGGIWLTTEERGGVEVNTRYIFGNALRDASGLVKLTDFKTNAEFNQVSEALNALIRTAVMPPIVAQLEEGQQIEVIGAIKLSKKHVDSPDLVITPTHIKPVP